MDKLKPYQRTALKWMQMREATKVFGVSGGILALDMGLGKTFISLSLIVSSLRSASNKSPLTLVVVPKTLIYEWKKQIQKFFKDLKVLYLHPDFIKNFTHITAKDTKQYSIVITSYEMCNTSFRFHDKHEFKVQGTGASILHQIRWTRIICDESQRFANPKTKLWKSMIRLSATYKWCLSGTPVRNDSTDIWAQLRFCGYCMIDNAKEWRQYGQEIFIDHDLIQFIYVLNFENANIKMPPKRYHTIRLKLLGEHRRIYLELLDLVMKEYTKFDEGKISFAELLVIFLRLRQCAISPLLVREDLSINSKAGYKSIKMLKIVDLMDQPGKFLIFSSFVAALDLIEYTLNQYAIKCIQINGAQSNSVRNANLDKFSKDPSIKCLLMTYRVGAEGLNITEASNCIIVEPWWNNSVHEQAISRCWRLGQTKPVNIYFLILANSIEEQIMNICREKDNIKRVFLEGLDEPIIRTGINRQMLEKILSLESQSKQMSQYINFDDLNLV